MSESVPTVIIVDPDNPEQQLVMNASDYNPDEHTLWEEKDKEKKPVPDKPGQATRPGGAFVPGSGGPKDAPSAGSSSGGAEKQQDTTPPSKAVYPDKGKKE